MKDHGKSWKKSGKSPLRAGFVYVDLYIRIPSEQWLLINPCWLMIGWGMILPFIYIEDFNDPIEESLFPKNQPGFDGMRCRDFVSTVHLSFHVILVGE